MYLVLFNAYLNPFELNFNSFFGKKNLVTLYIIQTKRVDANLHSIHKAYMNKKNIHELFRHDWLDNAVDGLCENTVNSLCALGELEQIPTKQLRGYMLWGSGFCYPPPPEQDSLPFVGVDKKMLIPYLSDEGVSRIVIQRKNVTDHVRIEIMIVSHDLIVFNMGKRLLNDPDNTEDFLRFMENGDHDNPVFDGCHTKKDIERDLNMLMRL